MGSRAKYRFETASRSHWQTIESLQRVCFEGDPTRMSRAEFDRLASGINGRVIIARFGLQVVGYIVTRRRMLPWESVAFVAVDPEHRGQGLATELIANASELSPRLFLRLHVRASNQAAISVYRKLGFVTVTCKRLHYADGEDALIMMCWNGFPSWRLNPPVQAKPLPADFNIAE